MYRMCLFYLQEQFANVTAVRTGIPLNSASLAEPVVYNIGTFNHTYTIYGKQ